jgi:hypothetical protein
VTSHKVRAALREAGRTLITRRSVAHVLGHWRVDEASHGTLVRRSAVPAFTHMPTSDHCLKAASTGRHTSSYADFIGRDEAGDLSEVIAAGGQSASVRSALTYSRANATPPLMLAVSWVGGIASPPASAPSQLGVAAHRRAGLGQDSCSVYMQPVRSRIGPLSGSEALVSSMPSLSGHD